MSLAERAIARRSPVGERLGVRAIAAVLLATIALVPSLARAHDRLQPTPTEEHSRFRWTNSCESVPQKIAPIVIVAAIDGPAQIATVEPSRTWPLSAPVAPIPVAARAPSPRPLRAPPAIA